MRSKALAKNEKREKIKYKKPLGGKRDENLYFMKALKKLYNSLSSS
jgi:hypothetical protein